MTVARYSARIGEAFCIGDDLSYRALLARLMEFTLRAAIARSADESQWEHEQLRRLGLCAVQLFHNGKAIWDDAALFTQEMAEARRTNAAERFQARNELDAAFYDRLDGELRARWRRLGYETPTLRGDMKRLFLELERDASERAALGRERMLSDLVTALEEIP